MKKSLLPVMPTSVQDYTTNYVALMPANVAVAVCVTLLHTMLMSVASMAFLWISDLIFLTVVSNASRIETLLKTCIILEMSLALQNTATDVFFVEVGVVLRVNDALRGECW